MILFNAVDLTMTAVARDHQHPGAGRPDLVRFSAGIKCAFLVVSGDQGAPSPAATDLVHVRRVKVCPVIHALAENPAGLFEKSMAKPFLGSSPIITRVMIGCRSFETRFIQFDAPLFNVSDEQIEYRDKFKFFEDLRMICFETRPGRKVGMPSFGPQECLDLQLLHLFDNAAAHGFHGLIIAGKISPVGSFPVFRRHGPVFLGHMENPPPVL